MTFAARTLAARLIAIGLQEESVATVVLASYPSVMWLSEESPCQGIVARRANLGGDRMYRKGSVDWSLCMGTGGLRRVFDGRYDGR